MQLTQIIAPCHTGWPDPIPIRAIQVGQCSWPTSLLCAIQVGQCSWPNHFSVPYRLAEFDTYPCHTGWPDTILSVSYRSANALGPNHSPVPYRLAGSDTYPCHTDRPMQVAQIIAPCHTGWPDPIPIRAIQVGQCSWPTSLLCAIQVGQCSWPNHFSVPYRLAKFDTYPCHTGWPDTILSVSYRSANALGPNHSPVPYRLAGSDTYPCHTGRPMQLAQIIAPCHTGWPDPIPICAIQVGQCSWPKSMLRAIQVGRIRYLSVSYRSANALGPNHFSVEYGLAGYNPIGVIQVGRIRYLSLSYRSANQVGSNHFSVPYMSANTVSPNHFSHVIPIA